MVGIIADLAKQPFNCLTVRRAVSMSAAGLRDFLEIILVCCRGSGRRINGNVLEQRKKQKNNSSHVVPVPFSGGGLRLSGFGEGR